MDHAAAQAQAALEKRSASPCAANATKALKGGRLGACKGRAVCSETRARADREGLGDDLAACRGRRGGGARADYAPVMQRPRRTSPSLFAAAERQHLQDESGWGQGHCTLQSTRAAQATGALRARLASCMPLHGQGRAGLPA